MKKSDLIFWLLTITKSLGLMIDTAIAAKGANCSAQVTAILQPERSSHTPEDQIEINNRMRVLKASQKGLLTLTYDSCGHGSCM